MEKAAGERHAEKMREYERAKREREEQHAAQLTNGMSRAWRLRSSKASAAAARGINNGADVLPVLPSRIPGR